MKIRLPQQLKDVIMEAAQSNGRTQNSEIVSRLYNSFSMELLLTPELLPMIEDAAIKKGVTVGAEIGRRVIDSFNREMAGPELDAINVDAGEALEAVAKEIKKLRNEIKSLKEGS